MAHGVYIHLIAYLTSLLHWFQCGCGCDNDNIHTCLRN